MRWSPTIEKSRKSLAGDYRREQGQCSPTVPPNSALSAMYTSIRRPPQGLRLAIVAIGAGVHVSFLLQVLTVKSAARCSALPRWCRCVRRRGCRPAQARAIWSTALASLEPWSWSSPKKNRAHPPSLCIRTTSAPRPTARSCGSHPVTSPMSCLTNTSRMPSRLAR